MSISKMFLFTAFSLSMCSAAPQRNTVAEISTCIPATLGSEALRKTQVWEYQAGLIRQPANESMCLTTTSQFLVQDAPAIALLPCASKNDPSLRANQTWELSGHGQIKQNGKCIDVAGYGKTPGSQLHLWTCTPTTPLPPPQTDANQLWDWSPDGSVHSVQIMLIRKRVQWHRGTLPTIVTNRIPPNNAHNF
eukprot:m.4462 g.4462  ORF g.4462 m.4462 type:complete len:192 (-) comp2992_c0_seq1:402-977(-)